MTKPKRIELLKLRTPIPAKALMDCIKAALVVAVGEIVVVAGVDYVAIYEEVTE